MDQALTAFREAADRENRHRRVRRRYSPTLQEQARAYWQQRRRHEGVLAIAAALGVSVTTLQRWTRGIAPRSRFRRVDVDHRVPSAVGPVPVVITMTAEGLRVEGPHGGHRRTPAHAPAMRWHGRWATVYTYVRPRPPRLVSSLKMGDSSSQEELMDEAVLRFRQTANHENRHRAGQRTLIPVPSDSVTALHLRQHAQRRVSADESRMLLDDALVLRDRLIDSTQGSRVVQQFVSQQVGGVE